MESTSFLIYAKFWITPIKGISIPRLELLSVLIGVQAAYFVLKQLEVKDIPVSLWSNLKCALFWIKNYSKLLPRFVQNRVEEIRKAGFVASSEQKKYKINSSNKYFLCKSKFYIYIYVCM